MARNKAVIGNDESEYIVRADNAERAIVAAESEVMMIRRRIRTFFGTVTQVRFPASPPSWAEDWPEWLETGTVAVDVPEETVEETPVEETPAA